MACALSASPAAALVASTKPTAAAPQCLSFPRVSFSGAAAARPSRLAAGSRSARARSFVARAAAEVVRSPFGSVYRFALLVFTVSSISHVSMRVRACVCTQNDLPLVGNKAPDFAAEAVFDQEFINVWP